MSEGLITIAYGPEKYMRMARALAQSYRRHNPKRPFAIVTDKNNAEEMRKYFDQVILVESTYGRGVVQKLHMDLYSPFEKTLFVDSDCIFYKAPERIWDLYAGKPFSMRGWRYLTGSTDYEKQHPYEWVEDTTEFLKKNNISRLPHFNSGVFFFTKSEIASKVFAEARSVYERRASLGFVQFKNAPIADEPAFAVAMERCGVNMDPWDAVNGMQTAINMEKALSMNVLNGQARFRKGGIECDPVLVHFNVHAQYSYIYNLELSRLEFEKHSLRSLYIGTAFPIRFAGLQIERASSFISRVQNRLRQKGLFGALRTRFYKLS